MGSPLLVAAAGLRSLPCSALHAAACALPWRALRGAGSLLAAARRGLAAEAQPWSDEGPPPSEPAPAPGPSGGGAAAPAAAAAAAPEPEPAVSGEGEVCFPRGDLLSAIQRHWAALQACPSAAEYVRRTRFDEFGARYIQQLEAEEAARCRALDTLQRSLAADARAGTNFRQPGGVLDRLVAAWAPLLASAIAAEQAEVLALGRGMAPPGAGRRDRHNYGPFLLLLPPEELAHITLQTVLSRVATALPESDDADATSWNPANASAGSSTAGSSSWAASAGGGGGAGVPDARPGEAGMAAAVPAVLLADSLGRAINSRLRYLRFKAEQHEAALRKRAAVRKLRSAEGRLAAAGEAAAAAGEATPAAGAAQAGPELTASLERYVRAAEGEASRFKAGQERLQALSHLVALPVAARRAAAAARADVRWEPEARIKVGAALLALLMENCHLPDGLAGRRPQPWRRAGAAGGGSSSSSPSSAGASSSGAAGFEYVYVSAGLKQQAFVAASGGLVQLLLSDRRLAAALLTKVPPMLVPPLPWSGHCTGGYLSSRHWIMRTRFSSAMQERLRRGMAARQYDQVLASLNVLGNTSWSINPAVYRVLCALWDAKSTAAGLPSQVPLRPPAAPPTRFRLLAEGGGLVARGGPLSRRERRGHTLACDEVRRLNRNAASLKADFLLKKQVADEFVSAPEFFYPHTLDFRGRAYPLHPSLHHLGDDMCRGLLRFGRGAPLGPSGLDWLLVHLANVWGQGQDKTSFDARRAFARGHLATVLAVASDPLSHTWWQGAEKPWQALAACCEIAAALQSLDPPSFVSRLPVHMDGSCNGLQHYAALGRDEAGGRAVNLLPCDKPQDVYKQVSEIVAARVAADAASDHHLAARCVGLIDRKLVKQTVMTSVYGVTSVGARAQVEARLREKRADMKARAAAAAAAAGAPGAAAAAAPGLGGGLLLPPAAAVAAAVAGSSGGGGGGGRDEHAWMDDKDMLWQVSKYLSSHTLGAIGAMFSAARCIMAWLADCARVVAASGAPVAWDSPLGLPIMQPYHRLPMVAIRTTAQSFWVVAPDGDGSSAAPAGGGGTGSSGGGGDWIKSRQRSAFPPNFIHSIDSTHMMLTALACNQAGIEFAGVHDSFWTHAGHVATMNRLLRDKFVELHTRQPDLLEDLRSQLVAQHPQLAQELPPIPERGCLQVSRVRHSRYFFS